MKQENIDAVKDLLDRWANWVGAGGSTCDGMPRQSPGAPDARVQSIEDLELENEKFIIQAVNTAVYDLATIQKDVILIHYGFKHMAWTQDHDGLFDLALMNLYYKLRERVTVCN
jgi:hypothetical protein